VPASPHPWLPQSVQWLSSRTAYVFETQRCGARTCARLLLTTDDGLHFKAQPAASAAGVLTFANIEDAYRTVGAGGLRNALFQSDDAAKSWRAVSFGKGTTVYALTTSDDRVYAVVLHCTGVYACSDYRLYRSSAGSPSWTSSAIPDTGGLHGSTAGLAAFGRDVWVSFSNGGPATMLFSGNEGRSFSVVATGIPGIGCWPAATSSTVVWLSCDTGNYGHWSRSSDGGRTFPGLPLAGDNASRLEAVSDSVAIFQRATLPVALERTTNGGKTFLPVATPLVPAGAGLSVAFGDDLHGLAIVRGAADGSLWRTSNGGLTWSQAAP